MFNFKVSSAILSNGVLRDLCGRLLGLLLLHVLVMLLLRIGTAKNIFGSLVDELLLLDEIAVTAEVEVSLTHSLAVLLGKLHVRIVGRVRHE